MTTSLEAWLRRCVPTTGLDFDGPGSGLPDAGGGCVLRAFLYDVREEERGRSGGMYLRDGTDSSVTARLQPLRVLQYSYQLTAYGADWREHQRVLGEVMLAAAAVPSLPDDTVDESFAVYGPGALPLVVAPAAPVPFPWPVTAVPSAPALHLVVKAPLRPPADTDLRPAPDRVELGTRRTDGAPESAHRRTSALRPRRRIEE
ncbi:Pvc16 family protein [Streptomyces sp. NPDC088729]|uniref:Pvc16 family protein n=1 Tax=Streptomyces sp. NPDC088729 TaxID=3365876 RepID=UPI0038260467